ncbi:MAG: hypothetical protein IV100_13225 [Myxococcales bacterium]|nr:hypothetical protein [Myxococcales bacterium]
MRPLLLPLSLLFTLHAHAELGPALDCASGGETFCDANIDGTCVDAPDAPTCTCPAGYEPKSLAAVAYRPADTIRKPFPITMRQAGRVQAQGSAATVVQDGVLWIATSGEAGIAISQPELGPVAAAAHAGNQTVVVMADGTVATLRDAGVKSGDYAVSGLSGAVDVVGGTDHAVIRLADGSVVSVTAAGATKVLAVGKAVAIGAVGSAGYALGDDQVLRRFASGPGPLPAVPGVLEGVARFAAGDAGLVVELTTGTLQVFGGLAKPPLITEALRTLSVGGDRILVVTDSGAAISWGENGAPTSSPGPYVAAFAAGDFDVRIEAPTCVVTDECASDFTYSCPIGAACIDTEDGYVCECPPGTIDDGLSCADIDECAMGTLCPGQTSCVNAAPGYSCVCPFGLVAGSTPGSCVVSGPCASGVHTCTANAHCAMDGAAPTCTCNPGYVQDTSGSCIDVDECASPVSPCHWSTICVNTVGSYTCGCGSTGTPAPNVFQGDFAGYSYTVGAALLPGLPRAIAIDTYGVRRAAVSPSGQVYAWIEGQNPALVAGLGAGPFVEVALGESHLAALRSSGTIAVTPLQVTPNYPLPAGLTNVVAITLGRNNGAALKRDGRVVAFGFGLAGQGTLPSTFPTNVRAIAAGDGFTVAITWDDALVCFGDCPVPTMVAPLGRTGLVGVRAHGRHVALLTASGSIIDNLSGALVARNDVTGRRFLDVDSGAAFIGFGGVSDPINSPVYVHTLIGASNGPVAYAYDAFPLVGVALGSRRTLDIAGMGPGSLGVPPADSMRFMAAIETACELVDDCLLDPGQCDPNADCVDPSLASFGDATCVCRLGYVDDGAGGCTFVPSCDTVTCGANAHCEMTDGLPSCVCDPHYESDASGHCVDADECADAPCDPNAWCTNTPGSFLCLCKLGWEGDGLLCTDIDECSRHPATGSASACGDGGCTNTPGAYECDCGAHLTRQFLGTPQLGTVTPWVRATELPLDSIHVTQESLGLSGQTWPTGYYAAARGPQGDVHVVSGNVPPVQAQEPLVEVVALAQFVVGRSADGRVIVAGQEPASSIPTVASTVGLVTDAARLFALGAAVGISHDDGSFSIHGSLPRIPGSPAPAGVRDVVSTCVGRNWAGVLAHNIGRQAPTTEYLAFLSSDGTIRFSGSSPFVAPLVVPGARTIACSATRLTILRGDGTLVIRRASAPTVDEAGPIGSDFVDVGSANENLVALRQDGDVVVWQVASTGMSLFFPESVRPILDIDGSAAGNSYGHGTWLLSRPHCLPNGNALNRECELDCDTGLECLYEGANGTSPSCVCADGTTLDPSTGACVDQDECADGTHLCDPSAVCINTPGGYECGCAAGHTANPTMRVYDAVTDVPRPLVPGTEDAVAVDVRGSSHVVLRRDGSVVSWGPVGLVPASVNTPGGSPVVAIAAGASHAIALRADGTAVTWGDDAFGEAPGPVPFTSVVSVGAGDHHTLIVTADGALHCLGLDDAGQCSVPAELGPGSEVVGATGGRYFTAVRTRSRKLITFGDSPMPETNAFFEAGELHGDGGLLLIRGEGPTHSSARGSLRILVGETTAGVPVWRAPTTVEDLYCETSANLLALNGGILAETGLVLPDSFALTLFPPTVAHPTCAPGYPYPTSTFADPNLPWFARWTTPPLSPLATVHEVQLPIRTLDIGISTDGTVSVVTALTCVPPEPCSVAGCDPNATCSLIAGEAVCTCNPSFVGDGLSCQCPGGYVEGDAGACVDVNECDDGTDDCLGFLTTCTNTPGGYVCSCPTGWQTVATPGGVACEDVNECAQRLDDCQAPELCYNLFPSYLCECPDGYFKTGSIQAFGDNAGGQVSPTPHMVDAVQVDGGGAHSAARSVSGTVMLWGDDSDGQLALPSGVVDAIDVDCGEAHTIIARRNGQVLAFGRDDKGQATVPAGVGDAIDVAAGRAHSVALRADGQLTVWGDGASGQLAVPAAAQTGAIAIAAGDDFTLALLGSGQVVAWGENGNGQASPPASLSNVIAIAAGAQHAVALRADGTVVAWGDDGAGQVSGVNAFSSPAVAIAAGGKHSVLLLGDGSVAAVGSDATGQATPPALLGPVYHVGAGARHTLVHTRRMCADIDECVEGPASCDAGQICENQPGTFSCATPAGCDPNPCVHGACLEDKDGTIACLCEKFWWGELCDLPVNETACEDGRDDDQDGAIDCDDPDCDCPDPDLGDPKSAPAESTTCAASGNAAAPSVGLPLTLLIGALVGLLHRRRRSTER